MLEAVFSFFKSILGNTHAVIKCMFSSKCCNTSTVSEPVKIVKVVNVFDCFSKENVIHKLSSPWKRYVTV
jgi:hypothetical protein